MSGLNHMRRSIKVIALIEKGVARCSSGVQTRIETLRNLFEEICFKSANMGVTRHTADINTTNSKGKTQWWSGWCRLEEGTWIMLRSATSPGLYEEVLGPDWKRTRRGDKWLPWHLLRRNWGSNRNNCVWCEFEQFEQIVQVSWWKSWSDVKGCCWLTESTIDVKRRSAWEKKCKMSVRALIWW